MRTKNQQQNSRVNTQEDDQISIQQNNDQENSQFAANILIKDEELKQDIQKSNIQTDQKVSSTRNVVKPDQPVEEDLNLSYKSQIQEQNNMIEQTQMDDATAYYDVKDKSKILDRSNSAVSLKQHPLSDQDPSFLGYGATNINMNYNMRYSMPDGNINGSKNDIQQMMLSIPHQTQDNYYQHQQFNNSQIQLQQNLDQNIAKMQINKMIHLAQKITMAIIFQS